jgi:exonuclease SbcC
LGERLGTWRQQFAQRDKLQQSIVKQQQDLQQLQDEQTARSRKHNTQSAQVEAAALAQTETASALQTAQAEQVQRLAGQTPAALRQQWQAEQGHVHRWQQLEAHAQARRALASQQATLAAETLQGVATIAQQQATVLALREQFSALKEQVADKQQLLAQEQRIQSLDAHRQALQPGEACPLCGAVEHPAIAAYQALDVSATAAALQHKQEALDALVIQGQAAADALATSKAKQTACLHQQEKVAQQISQWHADWAASTSQVRATPALMDGDWQSAETLAAGLQAATQALAQLASEMHAAEVGEQAIQRAQATASQATQALQTAHTQLALLQQAAQDALARQVSLEQTGQANRQELAALETSLQATLQVAGYNVPDQHQPWLQERDGEWQHWQQTQTQLQTLSQALIRQQAACDAAQVQASQWAQRWADLQAAWAKEHTTLSSPPQYPWHPSGGPPDAQAGAAEADLPAALSACSDAITRLAQTIATLKGQQAQVEAALAQQRAALASSEAAWRNALHASPFADATAFEEALLPEAERQRLMTLKESLHTAQQRASALLQAAQTKQALLQAQALTSLTPEEIASHLAELELQRSNLEREIGAQRALLASDAQSRSNQQALFAQIGIQTAEADLWQRLDGLIGSARGDKFRKFAQGLTLDHLLHLANRHLARLHGRYLLRRKATGELELDIVDAWQGDTTRDTRTLSGGEGFLVSLALALALSDLVSNKTSIDSLFLDEGFGSLDGDTLEIALTALDSLNASGKMIGIISHVEALKERIPAQIRVEKGGGIGHSRLVV